MNHNSGKSAFHGSEAGKGKPVFYAACYENAKATSATGLLWKKGLWGKWGIKKEK
jgi:hypothetical protein